MTRVLLLGVLVYTLVHADQTAVGIEATDAILVTRFDDPEPIAPCIETDCSLRAAILLANERPGMDEIVLTPGRYLINLGGTHDRWFEDGALTADLDISDNVIVRGAGQNSTTITEIAESERAFDVHGGAHVTLLDLAIRDLGIVFAPSSCGKAIRSSGELTLERVTISRNSMRGDGGGVCNLGGNVEMKDSVVEWSCGCVFGRGGGIYSSGGRLTLERVTVANNLADVSDGGGIYSTGVVTIKDSIIHANRLTGPFGPKRGGGIFATEATLLNVTISGNAAEPWPEMEPIDHLGGGLYVAGEANLTNVTIVENSASLTAGGIYVQEGGGASIVNTIIANNVGGDCGGSNMIASIGHNLAGDDTCGFSGDSDMNATNPLLALLAGVHHGTGHSPLIGSPAIDAGDAGACPAADQRGVSRPKDGDDDRNAICDIGAYEARFADMGDVDCDGDVTTLDGLWLLRGLGKLPADAECFSAADLTGDSTVDLSDLTYLLRILADVPP